MCKKIKVVSRFPLRAGAFVCDVCSNEEAQKREQELLEELELSEYVRSSNFDHTLGVVKRNLKRLFEDNIGSRDKWREKSSEKRSRYFQTVALYLELLLLLCHNGPGIDSFDKTSREAFSVLDENKERFVCGRVQKIMAA